MTDAAVLTFGTLRVQGLTLGVDVSHLAEVCPVTTLHPMMRDTAHVLGSIDLRGHLIPVLDAGPLCGLPARTGLPPFAAVLKCDTAVLAIGVDEITGLSSVAPQLVQTFAQGGPDGAVPCLQAFHDRSKTVTILDAKAIFARPGVPTANALRYDAQATVADHGETRKVLVFTAGGAAFAVAAAEVYGTVPRQEIERNALTSGMCLGSIIYRDRRVPVLCTVSLLGVGHRRSSGPSELVILQCAGDRLLGLAVDQIKSLRAIPDAIFGPMPEVAGVAAGLLARVLVTDDGTQIFDIDVDRLRDDPQVRAISGISTTPVVVQATDQTGPASSASQVESRKFLVYDCGGRVATPIEQIKSILKYPAIVLPLVDGDPGIVGLFAFNGHSVPLVDLQARAGRPAIDTAEARILLVGTGARQMGFVVSRVHSIASGLRRFVTDRPDGQATIVQLTVAREAKMCDLLDLALTAEGIGMKDSAVPSV